MPPLRHGTRRHRITAEASGGAPLLRAWTMDYARDISAKYGLTIENFRTKGSTGGRFKFDFVRNEYPYTKEAEDIYAFI